MPMRKAVTQVKPPATGFENPFVFTYTTTPLSADAIYTSAWTDWFGYGFSFIIITAYADVEPAKNGIRVQFSNDGITVHDQTPASELGTVSARMRGRYQRIQYGNGGLAQTAFSLSRRMVTA